MTAIEQMQVQTPTDFIERIQELVKRCIKLSIETKGFFGEDPEQEDAMGIMQILFGAVCGSRMAQEEEVTPEFMMEMLILGQRWVPTRDVKVRAHRLNIMTEALPGILEVVDVVMGNLKN